MASFISSLLSSPFIHSFASFAFSHHLKSRSFLNHSSNHCRTHLIPLFRHFLKMFSIFFHSYSHTRRRLPFLPSNLFQNFIHLTHPARITCNLALLKPLAPPFSLHSPQKLPHIPHRPSQLLFHRKPFPFQSCELAFTSPHSQSSPSVYPSMLTIPFANQPLNFRFHLVHLPFMRYHSRISNMSTL